MSAYLDHAATTPLRPEALQAMLPFLTEHVGNPTGMHGSGRLARQALDEAREVVARALGADPSEVVFTSGGTESDNLAITGFHRRHGGRVLCSAVEHHAVLRTVEALDGGIVPVDRNGVVDLEALETMLGDDVTLLSVMAVNNETGVIQPLHKVRRLLERKAPHVVLHTDAVQAPSWIDVASHTAFADMVSLSAHKFGGPQGVGALVLRSKTKIDAVLHGGGQERERRSGTQNVAGVVGMAAALSTAVAERDALVARCTVLRDRLLNEITGEVAGARETVDRSLKTAANAHLVFDGVESEALLVLLDDAGVHASAGASCSSGAMEPSHVLVSMGLDEQAAASSLRLTLGHTTTDHDVDLAVKSVVDAVARLRGER